MEDSIVAEKFDEWASGRTLQQAMISIYEHIRDIPYAIIPELRDLYQGPPGMLKQNRGSCLPKHFLMAWMFERLKIPVRYATYFFWWESSPVDFPRKIEEVVQRLPVEYHLALHAFLDNRWVLVDATWDLPLRKAGFHVNEQWDGLSDTKNAVVAMDKVVHKTALDRVEFVDQHKSLYTQEEKAACGEFVPLLNSWLEDVRKKAR